MRVRINSYSISNSAKVLSKSLGAKRLLIRGNGTRFVAKNGDVIINWGIGKANYRTATGHTPTILNPIDKVRLASNKIKTLQVLEENGVSVPTYYTNLSSVPDGLLYVARTTVNGHSGKGIHIGFKEEGELPEAPLYTEFIDKVREYRAIVVGNTVVDFKQKKKKRGEEHDEHVWNVNGGYIFARNDIIHPTDADTLAIDAIDAIGLDFGAVDIIEDEEGKLYVLEINTAFGLEGTTIELVSNAIKELL